MAEVKKEDDFEAALDRSFHTPPGPSQADSSAGIPEGITTHAVAGGPVAASQAPADGQAKAEAGLTGKVAVPGTMPLQPESFRDNALSQLSAEMKYWHGPSQFLRAHYKTPEDIANFQAALDAHFPARPELQYLASPTLPLNTDERVCLRLSDLGFNATQSSKPPPFLHTCLELLDEFLTNSVVTDSDPLLLYQGPDEGPGTPFWTHFVKGAARTSTMLFLAAQVIERGWCLDTLAPDLQRSLTAIFARRELLSSDSQSIALTNAKLSQSGSIRKAHCVLTWLGKLRLLQQNGLNPEQVLKTWNASATQAGALTGNKRAVLQALNMPAAAIEVLLTHLSEFGDRTAFAEDAWSNKKLCVGARSRSGSKTWNDRLQVSAEAVTMMVKYVHEQHKKKAAWHTSKDAA